MNQPVTTDENTYSGLPVKADQISAFRYVQPLQTFLLSLKNRENILRFIPDNEESFREWLNSYYIREYKT